MDYLNRHFGKSYDLDPVLDAIEESISPIKKQEPWGYMAEYFLSAKFNLHRNYADISPYERFPFFPGHAPDPSDDPEGKEKRL